MTISHRWRPWIAGATVLVIAVVSGVAGWWIVKDDAEADEDVRTLPVLAPIGYGDTAPPVENEDGSMVRSPVQETREVPFVDGEPRPQRDLVDEVLEATDPRELIDVSELAGEDDTDVPPLGDAEGPGTDDELDTDDHPILYLPHLDWTDLSPFLRRDDPCAPEDGTPAGDCPDGEPGRIGEPQFAPAPDGDAHEESDGTADDAGDGVGAGRSGLLEEPGVPPTSIRPLTAYSMLLTAPHRDDVRIGFNVQVLDPGERPDCGKPGDRLPLADHGEGASTRTVEESWLREHGYDTSYTKRTTMIVLVPEGSRILGCVAEYDGDRPSWDWFEAQRRTWRVLESPDTVRPVVSVDSVHLFGDVEAGTVDVNLLWPNGLGYCGLVAGPSVAGNEMDTSDHSGSCAGDEFGVTGGDATVSATVQHDGTSTTTRSILPIASLNCPECLSPSPTWYSIPLKIETGPVEMCGSGIQAPCDPLKAREAVGTVRLRVDWDEGATNGRDRWARGEVVREDVESEPAELPQLETINQQATFATVKPTEERRGQVNARYNLVVDRPVDFEVRLTGDCWIGGAQEPITGHTADRQGLTFGDLCFDSDYQMSVTLTDESGATVTYDRDDWIYATFHTPSLLRTVEIDYTVEVEHEAAGGAYLLQKVVLRIGDTAIDLTPPEGERCFPSAAYAPPGGVVSRSVRIGSQTPVTFEVDVVPTDFDGTTCDDPPYDYYRPVTVTQNVSMRHWPRSGDGVRVESPPFGTFGSKVEVRGEFDLTARPFEGVEARAPGG